MRFFYNPPLRLIGRSLRLAPRAVRHLLHTVAFCARNRDFRVAQMNSTRIQSYIDPSSLKIHNDRFVALPYIILLRHFEGTLIIRDAASKDPINEEAKLAI